MNDQPASPSPADGGGGTPATAMVPLREIFALGFRIGIGGFGGGLTGWVFREAVQQRRWIGEEEYLSALALSQSLPGANIANILIYLGDRLRGLPGAAAALIGLLFAPFFITVGLGWLYLRYSGLPTLQTFLDGAASAAIGLLLIICLKGGWHAARRPSSLAVFVATFVAVGLLQWPLVPVVIAMLPISLALAWARSAPEPGSGPETAG